MQYELSYTNILNMLDLAGVPLRAEDRKSLTPIVAFGGPCACNPEPVAEFADIIFLGEGEETTNTVLDLLKECKESGKSKQEFLEAAMHIVQSIMVCYGISMELPVIHCLLVLSGWIVPIIF